MLGDLPLRPKGGDLGKEQVKEFDEFDEMIRNVCLKTPHEAANVFLMETLPKGSTFPKNGRHWFRAASIWPACCLVSQIHIWPDAS